MSHELDNITMDDSKTSRKMRVTVYTSVVLFVLLVLLLLSSCGICDGRPIDLKYIDARTNFSVDFLRSACQRPVHSAWSSCIRGLGPSARDPSRDAHSVLFHKRAGRALVLPPFPRFAVVNPMHALVDHLWAYATIFASCFDEDTLPDPAVAPTIILLGVRRRQIEQNQIHQNLTARLDLDLEHLIPVKRSEELPNPLDYPPTWGQWMLHLWASASVPSSNIIYEDDLSKVEESSALCFSDGIMSLYADFYGTAFRNMRIDFRPSWVPTSTVQMVPWADFPERWKARGLDHLRAGIASKLDLDISRRKTSRASVVSSLRHSLSTKSSTVLPSKTEALGDKSDSDRLRILVHTRLNDSRRRWHNGHAVSTQIRQEFGSLVDVQVLDATEQMSLVSQARAYNWADVLIGVHGASMANAIFMRDGSSVIEIWRCCYDKVQDNEHLQLAWTGWLLSRLRMSLSYVGCEEVDHNGQKLLLSTLELSLSSDQLCARTEHMNPPSISVNASSVIHAMRSAVTRADQYAALLPEPPLRRTPDDVRIVQDSSGRGNGRQTSSAVVDFPADQQTRMFAPDGPAWTLPAVWTPHVQSALSRYEKYLMLSNQNIARYWAADRVRFANKQPPETIDVAGQIISDVNDTCAWHKLLTPETERTAWRLMPANDAALRLSQQHRQRRNPASVSHVKSLHQQNLHAESTVLYAAGAAVAMACVVKFSNSKARRRLAYI